MGRGGVVAAVSTVGAGRLVTGAERPIPFKSGLIAADRSGMWPSLPFEFWVFVNAAAGWMVLHILRTLGNWRDQRVTAHDLLVQAATLKLEYVRRLRAENDGDNFEIIESDDPRYAAAAAEADGGSGSVTPPARAAA